MTPLLEAIHVPIQSAAHFKYRGDVACVVCGKAPPEVFIMKEWYRQRPYFTRFLSRRLEMHADVFLIQRYLFHSHSGPMGPMLYLKSPPLGVRAEP